MPTVISWIKGQLLVNPKTTVALILHVDTIWIVSQNHGRPGVGKPFPKSDRGERNKDLYLVSTARANEELPDEIGNQIACLDICHHFC